MKNAGAAISSRRVGVNILRTGGLKNFRTEEKGDQPGGGGGGTTFTGGSLPHYLPCMLLIPNQFEIQSKPF